MIMCIDKLKNMEFFQGIKEESFEKFLSCGEIVKFKKGEHIFREKEEINRIYIVIEGNVSIYKFSETTYKKIIFILGENCILNEGIVDNFKASVSCEAFEESQVLSINKKDFLGIMEGDFELTKKVIEGLSKKSRRMYRQIKNSTSLKIEKRIAAKLWKLSKDFGVEEQEGKRIGLNISVTYLSEMFGIPRETVSRGLNKLIKENLIAKNNKNIFIIDEVKLSEYFKGM